MAVWVRTACGNQFLLQNVNGIRIFCMDHDCDTGPLGLKQRFQNGVVIRVKEHSFVGHKHLYRRITSSRQRGDLIKHIRPRIGHHNVKSIIRHCDSIGPFLSVVLN